ncbi:hypothetical protein K491DRAFT_551256, partial [Lophiostoma macrostomum CBS 122681]
ELIRTLAEDVLAKEVLTLHCPLDYEKHAVKPKEGLGALDILALEIKQEVLERLDVQSLLTFRRVNQEAMDVVNGMVTWKKVLDNAPDTIRMAIGAKVAHRFTLCQLLDKICQKHCDTCGHLAPYINVYTVTRLCRDLALCPG